MREIQDIFTTYGPEYLERFGESMPAAHKNTLNAIMNCGKGAFGMNFFACDDCGNTILHPCSCGNRHCPICQHAKTTRWLETQLRKRLPCNYFLITFTVPKEVRPFLRKHQRAGYDALFDAAANAIKKLAKDPRFVGADEVGAVAVLHTWGRTLNYHPHIHFIVPGGGLSKNRTEWRAAKPGFFIRVEPLSSIFRAKFRDVIKKHGLLESIDNTAWLKAWNVNSQAVGNGESALKYIAPYVFRVAISNNRIVNSDNGKVTFKYKKSHSNRFRNMTVDASEFIRRFLQHVLPTGFMKIRHYGFLSSNAATPLDTIRNLICAIYEIVKEPEKETQPTTDYSGFPCERCGRTMKWQRFISPLARTG